MPKRVVPLTAAQVKNAKPGTLCDGAGLYLVTRSAAAKFWIFKYTDPDRPYIDKKTGALKKDKKGRPLPLVRVMGLGPAAGPGAVSLAEARTLADSQRQLLRAGGNPLEAKKEKRAAKLAAAAATAAMTFKQAARGYVDQNEAAWKNDVHRKQWSQTLEDYAYPVLGDLPVSQVTTDHVLRVLRPLWKRPEEGGKPETASRLRGRIETILDFAKAQGARDGENPARWRNHLALILPKRSKLATVKHHAAVPWRDMPAFWAELSALPDVGPQALRFAILTAARTEEVIGARWPEIDLEQRVWSIPAERMKATRPHRVPLSDEAMAVLEAMLPQRATRDAFVFPGDKPGKGLSNAALLAVMQRRMGREETPHGTARSSFRDWCGEATSHPNEIAEMALAHTLKDKTEAAYRRGDLLDRRRVLMQEWADYLKRPVAEVASLAEARAARAEGAQA